MPQIKKVLRKVGIQLSSLKHNITRVHGGRAAKHLGVDGWIEGRASAFRDDDDNDDGSVTLLAYFSPGTYQVTSP